jgi:hypothetical protein
MDQHGRDVRQVHNGHRQVALSAAIHGVSSLVSSLAAACSDFGAFGRDWGWSWR